MSARSLSLGLRANWRQFALLVVINAFVGAMVGLERTVLPLIAEADFKLVSKSIILSFLISFGIVKALSNLIAGRLSDRLGRKRILVAGWLFGLPVPFLLIYASHWSWVVLANALLGINQGLCWSTTVIMKIDLVGPNRRGLAMGLNEFAGYLAVSLTALLTGFLAATYGLRPAPFYPGIALPVFGFLASALFLRETQPYARLEAQHQSGSSKPGLQNEGNKPSFAQIFLITSWKDRALFASCQAGMINNLNDGMVWGLVPIFLAKAGLPLGQIGLIAGIYPGVWGISQLLTGTLSDRLGRKWMIASGMGVQALGIGFFVVSQNFLSWLCSSVLLGIGTALVYPTLIAAVSDVAHPEWRASAVGVYRLWRDSGYAIGALLVGFLVDVGGLLGFAGIPFAMLVIAALTLFSGITVALVMYETLPIRQVVALPQNSIPLTIHPEDQR